MFIDTHAHIFLQEFEEDIDQVIENAAKNEVEKILMPNIDKDSIERMIKVEDKYPSICFSMMGLHPCYVKEDFEEQLRIVEEWVGKRNFLAVGEIGTDLYWDKTFWDQQKEAFRFQCQLAVNKNLPVAIHCRESIDETISLLSQSGFPIPNGVFHCFTGTAEQGKAITEMGFYLGIGGVVTFKNGGMDKVIPELDPERILLETDSPYLSPVPDRGKRNEPAKVRLVAKKVAECLGITLEELGNVTTKNANDLFFS